MLILFFLHSNNYKCRHKICCCVAPCCWFSWPPLGLLHCCFPLSAVDVGPVLLPYRCSLGRCCCELLTRCACALCPKANQPVVRLLGGHSAPSPRYVKDILQQPWPRDSTSYHLSFLFPFFITRYIFIFSLSFFLFLFLPFVSFLPFPAFFSFFPLHFLSFFLFLFLFLPSFCLSSLLFPFLPFFFSILSFHSLLFFFFPFFSFFPFIYLLFFLFPFSSFFSFLSFRFSSCFFLSFPFSILLYLSCLLSSFLSFPLFSEQKRIHSHMKFSMDQFC